MEKRKSDITRDSSGFFTNTVAVTEHHYFDSRKVNQTVLQDFYEELNTLQSVFIRLSWKNKVIFIKSLLRTAESNEVLSNLTSVLGSLFTKDVIYVMSQNVHAHVYDIIPHDDNRSLSDSFVKETANRKAFWYMSTEEELQETALLALLKCGGGACVRKAFIEALQLLLVPNFCWCTVDSCIHRLPSCLPGYSHPYKKTFPTTTETTAISGTSGSALSKPTFNMIQNMSMTAVTGSSTTHTGFAGSLINSVNLINTMDTEDWQRELDNVRVTLLNLRSPQQKDSKTTEESNKFEKLQMFPARVNEMIISYLDQNSRNELKKVNGYWSFFVDEVKKEDDARSFIDKIIIKLKSQYSIVPDELLQKVMGGGKKNKAEKQPKGKGKQKPEPPVEPLEKPVPEELPKVSSKTDHVIKNFQNDPLNGRYLVTNITDKYCYNRLTACTPNGQYLITTAKSHTMVIHSLITGCQLPTKLMGHTGPITCLAVHPDGCHVVTGSVDATVRCWDFKRRIAESVLVGHTKTISAIAVNTKYIASSSYSKTVRVFSITNGTVFWLFEDQTAVVSSLLLKEDNHMFAGFSNGAIKWYNLNKKSLIAEFEHIHKEEVKVLLIPIIHPNTLISAGADGFIYCFRTDHPSETPFSKCSHGSCVTSVVATKFGYLISGCEDGRLRVWDITIGLLLKVIRPSADLRPIRNLHLLSNAEVLQMVVNMDSGVLIHEYQCNLPPVLHKKFQKNKCDEGGSCFSKQTERFSLSSFNNELSFYSGLNTKRSTSHRLPKIKKQELNSQRHKIPPIKSLYYCCAGSQVNEKDDDADQLRITDVQRLSTKEQRLKALAKRCCTLPKIRNKTDFEYIGSSMLFSSLKKRSTEVSPQAAPKQIMSKKNSSTKSKN